MAKCHTLLSSHGTQPAVTLQPNALARARRTLRDLGEGHYREALVRAAVAYERTGRIPDALRFYTDAGANAALGRLLAEHGLALIDQGESDVVESAIAALSEDEQHANPGVLGLKAILDSHAARFDTAEAW